MLSTLLTFSSIASASELAFYWGQNSAGTEQPLASYCQNTPGDVFMISFVNQFGNGKQIGMNIHGYYDFIPNTQLLNATKLGAEIKQCQQLGKKVLLSLGGAIGDYGLASAADAENVATDLWNYFAGGQSSTRPFGDDVKVDGFDLDAEHGGGSSFYPVLVNKLHELYASDASKQYVMSASPQCVYPDATLGDALTSSKFDYIFVQFYNNYCALNGDNFNFDTWQSLASSSPNPNVKVFAGLAGSPTAGSNYATIEEVAAKYPQLANSKNFGGFSAWDASQVNSNIINGKSYAQLLEELIHPAASAATTTAAEATAAATTAAANTDAPEIVLTNINGTPVAVVVPTAANQLGVANNSIASWTTVVKTFTTVLPCTTLSTPVEGGAPVQATGITTIVHTYTATEPCDTTTAPAPVAPAASAPAASAPVAPAAPAVTTSSYHAAPAASTNGTVVPVAGPSVVAASSSAPVLANAASSNIIGAFATVFAIVALLI